jgi:hypothetical protein
MQKIKSEEKTVDDQARITITCARSLKLSAKKAAAEKKIDKLNQAYLEIFKLGLKEFKKTTKKEES